MSDVVSAGTLVGAILETSGYIAQQHILNDFSGFLQYTAAHLYAVAVFAALIALVMFGSVRMARYLLLGPAIFWFLIAEQSETEGVLWTMHGSQSIPVLDLASEVSAEEDVPESIKISTTFLWYTSMVSGIIEEVVRMILRYHDKEDYLFFDRRYALDILLNGLPDSDTLIEILLGNVMLPCHHMMEAAFALSHYTLSEQQYQYFEAQLGRACSGTNFDPKKYADLSNEEKQQVDLALRQQNENCRRVRGRMQEILNARERLMGEYEIGRNVQVNLTDATKQFVIENQQTLLEAARNQPADIRGSLSFLEDILTVDQGSEIAKTKLERPFECGQLWTIAQYAIMEDAENIVYEVHKMVLGPEAQELYDGNGNFDQLATENAANLCETLAKKLGRFQLPEGYWQEIVPYMEKRRKVTNWVYYTAGHGVSGHAETRWVTDRFHLEVREDGSIWHVYEEEYEEEYYQTYQDQTWGGRVITRRRKRTRTRSLLCVKHRKIKKCWSDKKPQSVFVFLENNEQHQRYHCCRDVEQCTKPLDHAPQFL